MYLFAPGGHQHNRADRVKEALIGATNRGVANEVTQQGITVRFDSPTRKTHTELVIIGRRYVVLGSHNFTHSTLSRNNEASVSIESPTMARQALTYLQRIGDLGAHETVSATERGRPSARQSQ
jgi:phosphatidylserine/phosphatidylglycerophosphate/cardiolipin synthase-like enzyme